MAYILYCFYFQNKAYLGVTSVVKIIIGNYVLKEFAKKGGFTVGFLFNTELLLCI